MFLQFIPIILNIKNKIMCSNSITNVVIKKLNCESFSLLGSFNLETIQLNDALFRSTSKE